MKPFTKIVFAFFILAVNTVYAQQIPFADEIQAFKDSDKIAPPPANAILFAGSSSFRKWTDVQDYFPGYTIINRGFGGSSLTDLIYYADDIIFPYQPKQIVIYCGDNDLASSDTITPQIVFDRFKELFTLIRSRMKKVSILYVSIKPSPARKNLLPKMLEANLAIKNFLKKERNTAFADVYYKMLNANGTPIQEIFTDDSLHMNAKGYAVWQKVIEPYLIK